jgi:hypothetical protein
MDDSRNRDELSEGELWLLEEIKTLSIHGTLHTT